MRCSVRLTERRNRNVHVVHEDFECRATMQYAHKIWNFVIPLFNVQFG